MERAALPRYLLQQPNLDLTLTDIQKSGHLHLASTYGHPDIVAALIEAGAAINALDEAHKTPLHRAAQEGNVRCLEEIVRHLSVKEAGSKDDDGNTALMLAVTSGNSDCVRKLLKYGLAMDVNTPNSQHEFPLHSAARTGDLLTVKILVNVSFRKIVFLALGFWK